jgi:hypothetical protein
MSEYNELEYKYIDVKSKLKNKTILLIVLIVLCGISIGTCIYIYNELVAEEKEKKKYMENLSEKSKTIDELTENLSEKSKTIDELTSSYPIRITEIQFGNVDEKGNIITNYGEKLYDFRMRYLRGKITFDSYLPQSKEVEFKIKIRKPDGSISQGPSSPKGFTTKVIKTLPSKSKKNTIELIGWGNSNGGAYPMGEYEYEIWYNKCCLYVGYFRIY